MQRCPCCNARLSSDSLCPRCGADLGRIMRCEQLADAWSSVALQALKNEQPDIAVSALGRSLSYKQSQAARVLREFMLQHQYRTLYDCLAQKQWLPAKQTVARLRALQGDNEALSRFMELIEHLQLRAS